MKLLALLNLACLLKFISLSSYHVNQNTIYQDLAVQILQNQNYSFALNRSYAILKTFNAGTFYPQYWIRDINTFIEVALVHVNASEAKEVLLKFLQFQQNNGSIVDGIVEDNYTQKTQIFTNSVETDQETSLIQAFHKYIQITNDSSILDEKIQGLTVLERLRKAQDYLLELRFASQYGLLFGATTIDWGDLQPEDYPGTLFNNFTHPAIDIYDNAMWVIAINSLVVMSRQRMPVYSRYLENFVIDLKKNINKHLWNEKEQKYIPHIYLEKGSPFEDSVHENAIYYHGGTIVACQAGLLNKDQIQQQLKIMEENVEKTGNKITIGLTIYPPYKEGAFANPLVFFQYSYQNSGDWPWFGGRMVQVLIQNGFIEEANYHLQKMVDYVVRDGDYCEWYNKDGQAQGTCTFHGSAGVIGKSILMLQNWAEQFLQNNNIQNKSYEN